MSANREREIKAVVRGERETETQKNPLVKRKSAFQRGGTGQIHCPTGKNKTQNLLGGRNLRKRRINKL